MKTSCGLKIVIFLETIFGAYSHNFHSYGLKGFGPIVKQTNGQIWPKPQLQAQNDGTFWTLDVENFSFEFDKFASSCDLIHQAISRYFPRFFPVVQNNQPFEPLDLEALNDLDGINQYGAGILNKLEIFMNNEAGCEEYPHELMNEQYEIKIDTEDDRGKARLIGITVWGILRGLESFSQLIYTNQESGSLYFINRTQISDFPRFSYRGILLDSSRHFLKKDILLDNLDLMEMNKMNVFHWHITDDQSFPYESKRFPNLSKKGAYEPTKHVYTQDDVAAIIEAARVRGIRVVPEFDTPGHTQSWEPGNPGLLTVCNGSQFSTYGPLNPIQPSVYEFLKEFFQEVYSVFPDQYLHIGGDEVDLTCWQSNLAIQKYMHDHNLTDYKALESLFIQNLFKTLDGLPVEKNYIVWQEVFDNHDQVKPDTIIEVWKRENWETVVSDITKKGLRTIVSSPWYLNYISYGSDAMKYYLEDPQAFGGTPQQNQLVIGGEACMWGEFQNSFTTLTTLWPRASAVAERLWSAGDVRDVQEAEGRLQEHECRMMKRGYAVGTAFGPGFCLVN